MQVRFYEVTEEELEVARSDFASGKFPLQVAEEDFDFGAHAAHCASALLPYLWSISSPGCCSI